eukprot:3908135-Amphidinium_carterae.1
MNNANSLSGAMNNANSRLERPHSKPHFTLWIRLPPQSLQIRQEFDEHIILPGTRLASTATGKVAA